MIHAAARVMDDSQTERSPRSIRFEAHPEATKATCAGLDLLRALDWLVLHDLELMVGPPERPLLKVDHLLAGPSGVYLVASIEGRGPVEVTREDIRWGERSHAAVLTEIAQAAAGLRARLGGAPVAPMVCLERLDPVFEIIGEVAVCAAENVLGVLTEQPPAPAALPPVLVGSQVARLAGRRAASVRRASAAMVAGGPRHRAVG